MTDRLYIAGITPEQEQLFEARRLFVDEYCRKKGWDQATATIDQIMEIRRQDGWKNPEVKP